MSEYLKSEYDNGVVRLRPVGGIGKSMIFNEADADVALLAYAASIVAEKNGLTMNDFAHVFPALLRMLAELESGWAGYRKK